MTRPENEPAAIARGDCGGEQNQASPSYQRFDAPVKCNACGGHGTRLRRLGFGPEDPIVSEPCEHCEGTGLDIPATGISTVPGPDMTERDAMIDAGRPVRM